MQTWGFVSFFWQKVTFAIFDFMYSFINSNFNDKSATQISFCVILPPIFGTFVYWAHVTWPYLRNMSSSRIRVRALNWRPPTTRFEALEDTWGQFYKQEVSLIKRRFVVMNDNGNVMFIRWVPNEHQFAPNGTNLMFPMFRSAFTSTSSHRNCSTAAR